MLLFTEIVFFLTLKCIFNPVVYAYCGQYIKYLLYTFVNVLWCEKS